MALITPLFHTDIWEVPDGDGAAATDSGGSSGDAPGGATRTAPSAASLDEDAVPRIRWSWDAVGTLQTGWRSDPPTATFRYSPPARRGEEEFTLLLTKGGVSVRLGKDGCEHPLGLAEGALLADMLVRIRGTLKSAGAPAPDAVGSEDLAKTNALVDLLEKEAVKALEPAYKLMSLAPEAGYAAEVFRSVVEGHISSAAQAQGVRETTQQMIDMMKQRSVLTPDEQALIESVLCDVLEKLDEMYP